MMMKVVAERVDERFVHGARVEQVMWAPDGARLFTSARGELCCWDVGGRLLWRRLGELYGYIGWVCAGDALYVAGVEALECLDAATGEPRWALGYGSRFGVRLEALPGGDLFVAHEFIEIERLDLATRSLISLQHHDNGNGVTDSAISPDGAQVALVVDAGVWIVEVASGALVAQIELSDVARVCWPEPELLVVRTWSSQLLSFMREEGGAWVEDMSIYAHVGRGPGLACALDGDVVAMSGAGGDVVGVALEGGAQRWHRALGCAIGPMAASPDGRLLAVIAGQRVAILEMETGAPVCVAEGLPWRALALAPDGGRIIAGYAGGAVGAQVLDAETLAGLDTLEDASVGAFAPDGRIASAGTWLGVGEVSLSHDIVRGASWGEQRMYRQAAVTPDGRWLLAGGGGRPESRLELWDLHAEALHKTLVPGGMNTPGQHLCASPDGAYVACTTEHKTGLSLYDTTRWKKVAHKPVKNQIGGLAWSGGGARLYGVSIKGDVFAMAPADGALIWTQANKKVVWRACAAGGDALAVGSEAGELRVLDGATGEERARWSVGEPVTALLLTEQGRLYVAGERLSLRVFDVAAHVNPLADAPRVALAEPDLKPLSQRWHKNPLVSVALSPDRRLVATGSWLDHEGDGMDEAGELFVWEVETGACVRRVEPVSWGIGWPDYKQMVAFSPDSQRLGAAFSTNEIGVWSVAGRSQAPQRVLNVTDGQSRPPAWCWGADGARLAITTWINSRVGVAFAPLTARQIDRAHIAPLIMEPLEGDDGFYPDRLVWSRDGRWLCGLSHDTLEVYDARAHQLAYTLGVPREHVAWSDDGALLAISEQGYLSVVEVATGDEVWRVRGVAQGEPCFAPDGARVVVTGEQRMIVSREGSVRLADVEGEEEDRWGEAVADQPRAAWSPDGQRLALREPERVAVYEAASGELVWACAPGVVDGVAWGAAEVLVMWSAGSLVLWRVGEKKAIMRR